MRLRLADIQSLLKSQGLESQLVGDAAALVQRVHTDTRTLQAGDLFVALKGERFDAHDFLAQAQPASAALAERGLAEAGLNGLLVADTRAAFGALAKAWRLHVGLPLVAITGSNGKTTVTQMVASILKAWQGEAAHATRGNFNNDVGVPLTLLALREADEAQGPAHRVGVIELGMNHPGEIDSLASWTQPQVALVNNAQREHQEFMATVEAVARENAAVFAHLPADGMAVFPDQDTFTPLWRELAGARRVTTFALTAPADVHAREFKWTGAGFSVQAETPQGELAFELAMAGEHNVLNALAAASCALGLGVPPEAVARGLQAFRPVKGRSQLGRLALAGREVTLVDDSYNANPDSVRAAIDQLTQLPGPHWLVLGDMGEVGDQGPAFHREVGAYARERGISHAWFCGEACRDAAAAYGEGARWFPDAAAAAAEVSALPELPDTQAVLVKGSRFMRTEQVIAALAAKQSAVTPPAQA